MTTHPHIQWKWKWQYCPLDGSQLQPQLDSPSLSASPTPTPSSSSPVAEAGLTLRCAKCGFQVQKEGLYVPKPKAASRLLPSLSEAAVGSHHQKPPMPENGHVNSVGHARIRSVGSVTPEFEKPRWRKILYEPQPYEDNYVPDSFLALLRTNIHHRNYSFLETMQDTAAIIQELSIVALFVIVFIHALENRLSVVFLIAMSVVFAGFGLFTVFQNFGPKLMSSLLILLCLTIFSPILRTLTKSFSTDTIYFSSSLLLLIHLFFQDYGFINSTRSQFNGQVSLNAAISASVLLASRLSSDQHVFAFVMFAIELFALSPYWRHTVKQKSLDTHYFLSWIVVVITCGMLFPLSRVIAFLYLSIIIAVSFVAPWSLLRIQKYKSAIHGPWDEATVSR